MKIICSLNGIDGTGKTTQCELLANKYNKIIDNFSGLEKYKSFPKLEGQALHNWWFYDSTIEEFCDTIYKSLVERNNEILNSNKEIIIIDKGILNFEARIIATLVVRGFSKSEIESNIKKSKEKVKFKDIENLKILINKDKAVDSKIFDDKYEKNQIDIYHRYQDLQIGYILKNKFDFIIDYNLGIEKINDEIKKYIIQKKIEDMKKENYLVDIRNTLLYIGNTVNYINFKLYDTGDYFIDIIFLLEKVRINKLYSCQIFNSNIVFEVENENEMYKQIILNKANIIKKIDNKIKIKKIEDYNIPVFYKKILKKFIKEINDTIINIEMILIHGSIGRECVHDGWSDIDIIICINKYNFSDIKKISDIIDKYKVYVKIGTTIYSKLEIESLNVDAKTLFALYQMQNEEILPIKLKDVRIPLITYEDLINKNISVLPEAIHKLKRILYKEENIDKETLIKTLNLIMKVVLISNGIFVKSYEDIFYNFSRLYNIENLQISEYLTHEKQDEKKLIQYARDVIERLINY